MFDRSGRRKYLNRGERRAFRKAIKVEKDPFRKAFLLCLFYTGCRISEGLNVIVARIDLSSGAVIFETLKRRKRGCFRAVPVPRELMKMLGKLVKDKNPDHRIWDFSRPTAYRLVTGMMKKARVVGEMACPKGLRHGFGVACVAAKIPLSTIQKWMGHARIETTGLYLDVSGEEERALAKRLW